MTPTTLQAYQLFHDGCVALSQVEHNGIRIDTEYLEKTDKRIAKKIQTIQDELKGDDVYKAWRKAYRQEKLNMGSREQLAHVLFDVLKIPYELEKTASGRYRSDEKSFEDIDLPFLKKWVRLEKLKKLKGTYLKGLKEETINGFIHPGFNLHTVTTYRSSGSSPNFQNIPIRDPEIGKIIRRAFVARDGRVLVEIDYSALEFRIAACFWKDPEMVRYASDPTKDIHRDQAAKCFKCKPEEVNKQVRYVGKNQFVFPILYGSYYVQCARNLWASIDKLKLTHGKDADGLPMKKYLESVGIRKLGNCDPKQRPLPGTFEQHIKTVEDAFNSKFSVFANSKEKWWSDYQKTGRFQMMTGFEVEGVFNKNFLMNCPIQGPGFHCLLWSLVKIQKELRKRKMKTLLVGQIHDSLQADVPIIELQEFLTLAKQVMTEGLRKAWDWLIVPMEIEVDVTPENGSWYDKAPWIERNGIWQPKG